MHFTINDKSKQEIFVSIFQLLKYWNSYVSLLFSKDELHIQSMDRSHICLTEIHVKNTWFSTYTCEESCKVSVDSTHFSILMNCALKHNILEFHYDNGSPDKVNIHFLNGGTSSAPSSKKEKEKTGFDHFFELNLIDVDDEGLGIPTVEYNVDFIIESKKWLDLLSELNTFGPDMNIRCNEDIIVLNASGESAKLTVNIQLDDLDEYSINEGEDINKSFSLSHLSKMCCSSKLGPKVHISLSEDYPMCLKYDLGNESTASFYIAPKVVD